MTTIWHPRGVLRNVRWLIGAVVASLVAVPLLGCGIAEAFPLEGATSVALVLVASTGRPVFRSAHGDRTRRPGRRRRHRGDARSHRPVATPLTVDLIVSASDLTGGRRPIH